LQLLPLLSFLSPQLVPPQAKPLQLRNPALLTSFTTRRRTVVYLTVVPQPLPHMVPSLPPLLPLRAENLAPLPTGTGVSQKAVVSRTTQLPPAALVLYVLPVTTGRTLLNVVFRPHPVSLPNLLSLPVELVNRTAAMASELSLLALSPSAPTASMLAPSPD